MLKLITLNSYPWLNYSQLLTGDSNNFDALADYQIW